MYTGPISALKPVLKALGAAMLVLCLAGCVFTVFPDRAGLSVWRVASGSMEPLVPMGSLAYVRTTGRIGPGDVVLFYPEGADVPILHRVVSIQDDGRIVTKGDANPEADLWKVKPPQVIGTYLWHIEDMGVMSPYTALYMLKGLSVWGAFLGLAMLAAGIAMPCRARYTC